MDQILRHIEERIVVLPSYMIALVGWGRTITTGKSSGMAGAIITVEIRRAFRMACGCVIASPDESGSPCVLCRQEVLVSMARAARSPQVAVNLEEVNWISTPCKLHYRFCSVPLCSASCCTRHAGQLQDMKYYCLTHFAQARDSFERQSHIQEKGRLRVETARFVSSLFALPKP